MVAYASATSSDYKKCHRLKAKILEHCLKDKELKSNGINSNDICQDKSRIAYQSCHRRVSKSFQPMDKVELETLNKLIKDRKDRITEEQATEKKVKK
jgi:hypothetical protein